MKNLVSSILPRSLLRELELTSRVLRGMNKIYIGLIAFLMIRSAFGFTAIVNNVEYCYSVKDGEAWLVCKTGYTFDDWGFEQEETFPCISKDIQGPLDIPSQLDGYPVVGIGESAFIGCYELTSVTIPEGVRQIGENAFMACVSLKSVKIPASVTDLSPVKAFESCLSLETINIDPYNEIYCAIDGVFYTKSADALLFCPPMKTEVTIPATVTRIGSEAFKSAKIISIALPSSVKTIESDAFMYCKALKQVGLDDGLSEIPYRAFFGCSSLESVAIPSTVEKIDSCAFEACSVLKSVSIPKNVKTIGGRAFLGTHALSVVYVERGDSSRVADMMRDGGAMVDNISFVEPKLAEGGPYQETANGVEWTFFVRNGKAIVGTGEQNSAISSDISGEVRVPMMLGGCAVTTIGKSAFCGCSSITSISLPTSIVVIEKGAFDDCSLLEVVYVIMKEGEKARVEGLIVASGLSLDDVRLVERRPSGNSYRETIDDVEYVYSIADEKATITSAIVSGANDLKIPSELGGCPVTTISWNVFWGSLIEILRLPATIEEIKDGAFRNCHRLSSVFVSSTKIAVDRSSFEDSGLQAIYAPKGTDLKVLQENFASKGAAVDAIGFYEMADEGESGKEMCFGHEWSYYIEDGHAVIGTKNSTRAVSVNVKGELSLPVVLGGYRVEAIASGAFSNCRDVTSLSISPSITGVSFPAFDGCSSLKIVYVEGGDVSRVRNMLRDELMILDDARVRVRDSWDDYVEKKDGLEWHYQVYGGESIIQGEMFDDGWDYYYNAAIPESTSGHVDIPLELGGCPVTTISENAFKNCKKITSVKIPESVTSIGDNAFYNCSSLTSIEFPSNLERVDRSAFTGTLFWNNLSDGCVVLNGYLCGYKGNAPEKLEISSDVTRIGRYAFYYNSRIKEVVIPSSIKEIGASAFGSCVNLTTVTIPSSVKTIAESAFSWCSSLAVVRVDQGYSDIVSAMLAESGISGVSFDNLTFTESFLDDGGPYEETIDGIVWKFFILDNKATIETREEGVAAISASVSGEISVPSMLGGCRVVALGDWAFYGCEALTAVAIPSSVQEIGRYAFCGCHSLVEAPIPNSLEGLKEGVFMSCESLESVEFTLNMRTIGAFAFAKCLALKEVKIPSHMTHIATDAFANCHALKTVTVKEGDDERVAELLSESGLDTAALGFRSYYEEGGRYSKVINGIDWMFYVKNGDAVIGTQGGSAAVNVNIGLLVIPSSFYDVPVTKIDSWAISYNEEIESVIIPDGVTSIESFAFAYCAKLKSITIPSTVRYISPQAFASCAMLNIVHVAQGDRDRILALLRTSGVGVENLTIIEDNSEGQEIANGIAWKYYLENGKTVIGSRDLTPAVLTNISGIIEIPSELGGAPVVMIGDGAFKGCELIEEVVVPKTVMTFGRESFADCVSITKVNIPDSVTKIYDKAFANCSNLSSADIPKGVSEILPGTFYGCRSLERVKIPSSVVSIGDFAFEFCESLSSVTFAEGGLKRVGQLAFFGCKSLPSDFKLPATVETIESYAFMSCQRITMTELPSSLKRIGDYAFDNCESIQAITIPSRVSSIGRNPFTECRALTSVQVDPGNATFGSYGDAIYTKDFTKLVFYAAGKKNILFAPAVSTICDNAFESSCLTYVDIPSGVRQIGYGAFSYSDVKTVVVEPGVILIGGRAFCGCSGLKSVSLPSTVLYIADDAFLGCNDVVVNAEIGDGGRIADLMDGKWSGSWLMQERVTCLNSNGKIIVPEGKTEKDVLIAIVIEGHDIRPYLDLPAAVDGVIDLSAAVVKEEVVKEALDTEKGAEIELSAADPVIETAPTKPGLTYTLVEGTTLESMADGDSKLGDGTKWTPNITVKGGASGFYTIKVTK